MDSEIAWYGDEWREMAHKLKKALPDFLKLLEVQKQAIKSKAAHDTGKQRAERDDLVAKYDNWIKHTQSLIGECDELEEKYQERLHPDPSQFNGMQGLYMQLKEAAPTRGEQNPGGEQ